MRLVKLFSRPLVRTLVFGNYYYALCAVALSAEASLQQRYPLNGFSFYLLLFLAVVLYYNQAYLMTEGPGTAGNIRSLWYARNRRFLLGLQYSFLLLLVAVGLSVLLKNPESVTALTVTEWLLIFLFPFVSAMYYGVGFSGRRLVLRNVGWLKPFIIGFTWAGLVTVYPILYYCIENNMRYEVTTLGIFLFIKNLMFVTVLCIMFDIKDYAMDYNVSLKTFVVKFGLRRTIYYILIPLCVLGLVLFMGYTISQGFHPARIFFNLVPFISVIAVAWSLHSRRSIFYYLFIIDGLMLLKAACGIAGMIFFP
jgi:hypothetical protein